MLSLFCYCDSIQQALNMSTISNEYQHEHKTSLPLSSWTIASACLGYHPRLQDIQDIFPQQPSQLLTIGGTKVTLASRAKWGVGVRKCASSCVLHPVEEYQRDTSLLSLQCLPRHEFMGKSSWEYIEVIGVLFSQIHFFPSTAKIWCYTKLSFP